MASSSEHGSKKLFDQATASKGASERHSAELQSDGFGNGHRDGHANGLRPTETLDIFSVPSDGKPIWIRECAGLQQAREIMQQIAASSPGEYFIFHVPTGAVIERITVDGAAPNVDGSFSKDGH